MHAISAVAKILTVKIVQEHKSIHTVYAEL